MTLHYTQDPTVATHTCPTCGAPCVAGVVRPSREEQDARPRSPRRAGGRRSPKRGERVRSPRRASGRRLRSPRRERAEKAAKPECGEPVGDDGAPPETRAALENTA